MFQAPEKSQQISRKMMKKTATTDLKKKMSSWDLFTHNLLPCLAPSVIEHDCNPWKLWERTLFHDKVKHIEKKKFLYRAKWQQTRKTSVEILSTKRAFSEDD